MVQAVWLQSPNSYLPDAPASALCTEPQMLRENTGLSDPRVQLPFSGPRGLMTRRRSGSGTSVSQGSVSECECLVMADSLLPHGLWPTRLLCPWNSPCKNTGVGCHAFLQGIFPTQGLNPPLFFQLESVPILLPAFEFL